MQLTSSLLLLITVISVVTGAGLNAEFTWSRITYKWDKYNAPKGPISESSDADAIVFEGDINVSGDDGNGNVIGSIDYRYETNIPMGANVWKNKLFITVPRRRLGVPSSLNYIPLDSPKKHNVPLIPYPNWDINLYDPNKTENIVSVYRIAIDPCDRLWFVDTGIIETLGIGNPTQIKPTTITIIDLNTDKIVHRYEIPEENLRPNSGIASIKVDVTENTCGDAFAYIPDLSGYGLIVYSLKENKSWRVSHNYFYLEPTKGEFFIAGHHFSWNDGIFSVELTGVKPDGSRDMYFHSMAGVNIYKVSTRVLRNETTATRTYHENDFHVIGQRPDGYQSSSADIHQPTGIMFLGLVNQNAVACWNIREPLSTLSIVQKDDKQMIYPSDVKVSGDRVYVLTNTMPEFLYGRLDYDVTNFRVWSNTVENAVRGTKCHHNNKPLPYIIHHHSGEDLALGYILWQHHYIV